MPSWPSKSENPRSISHSSDDTAAHEHLEVETKFELSAQDFERVKAIGSVRRCERQLNVYYDAHWRLAESASTLRIRFAEDADPVLTLKVLLARNGEQRVMREFELRLREWHLRHSGSHHPTQIDAQNQLPRELGTCLGQLGVRYLQRVGWVRNTRLTLDVRDLGSLELDRLELPDGTVAYEAEIESDDTQAQQQLADLVRRYAFDARPSHLSKFDRFRRAAAAVPVTDSLTEQVAGAERRCSAGRDCLDLR